MIWSERKSPKIEEFPLENGGKKVIKYIKSNLFGNGFEISSKYFATFYEELIYDSNGDLISKKIKENPHYIPYKRPYDDDEV